MPRADFNAPRPTDPGTIVETVDRIHQAVTAAFKRQGNVVHTDQIVSANITKANTDMEFAHQLGAMPAHVSLGASVPTDASAPAHVWQSKPATKTTVTLRASAPCTVSVLIA